jgi:aminomuconate-semialdehyde/2-hydroxymuconate-6-semialdehyde dehydrogenase
VVISLPVGTADVAGVAVDTRHWIGGGRVWVNCFFVRDLRAPFGGAGQSGIGREGGTWSFDFYSDVKNTVYAGQGWRPDG